MSVLFQLLPVWVLERQDLITSASSPIHSKDYDWKDAAFLRDAQKGEAPTHALFGSF